MPADLVAAARRLRDAVDKLAFAPPVMHVYNPLRYAWRAHEIYLRRYGNGPKRVLFLGMNPGPFGMAQTGVPFGQIAAVRDWLGIDVQIDRPPDERSRLLLVQRPRVGAPAGRAVAHAAEADPRHVQAGRAELGVLHAFRPFRGRAGPACRAG